MESYDNLADHNQKLSLETVQYMVSVFPRLHNDLEQWEQSALSAVTKKLKDYKQEVEQKINQIVEALSVTPAIVNASVHPTRTRMVDEVTGNTKHFFSMIPRIKKAMNDTIEFAVNKSHENYAIDLPNGPLDFSQRDFEELYTLKVYPDAVMRDILKDHSHPLTKAADILHGRIDFYKGYRGRTLLKQEEMPVVGTEGPEQIAKVLRLFK